MLFPIYYTVYVIIHLLTSIWTETGFNINPSAAMILCGEKYGPYNEIEKGVQLLIKLFYFLMFWMKYSSGKFDY